MRVGYRKQRCQQVSATQTRQIATGSCCQMILKLRACDWQSAVQRSHSRACYDVQVSKSFRLCLDISLNCTKAQEWQLVKRAKTCRCLLVPDRDDCYDGFASGEATVEAIWRKVS
ncbi:unnamed protein product [Symbiodinium microadriaticum]|nr:unnamed protein product [Symbiodinium microadriaticum]